MSSNFSFNAPTYFDFNPDTIASEDSANAETYFEIDHENAEISASVDAKLEFVEIESYRLIFACQDDQCNPDTEVSEDRANPKIFFDIDQENCESSASVDAEVFISSCRDDQYIETSVRMKPCGLRKSISAGNLLNVNKIEEENTRKLSNIKIRNASKNRNSTTRPIHKWNDHINMLAQPKQMATQTKYISTSELVNKFYDTPERFHTWRKRWKPPSKSTKIPSSTIPQSPCLFTKHRQRTTNFSSNDEIEQRKIEENKKFKIKANPVNQKILQGPVKPVSIAKKPSTVVKPFHLSESHNKKVEEAIKVYEFHARPVPKSLYDETKTETNAKLKKRPHCRLFGSVEEFQTSKANTQASNPPCVNKPTRIINKTTVTAPVPFSFDARDKEIAKRRDEMINKVFEEERKAREFHAKPPPKYIFKKSNSLNNLKSNQTGAEVKDEPSVFKAKPPVVLYQKPFEPKKPKRTLIELTDICLNTDRRAKEREEFEKKMQEKLNSIAMEKQFRQHERERLEQEEIARLRRETVHTAQPIRHYKEVKIEPSGKVTTPITPNFSRTTKRCDEENKENTTNLVD